MQIKLLPHRAHPTTAYLAAAVWTCLVLAASYYESSHRALLFLNHTLASETNVLREHLERFLNNGGFLFEFNHLDEFSQRVFRQNPTIHKISVARNTQDELLVAIAPGSEPTRFAPDQWHAFSIPQRWGTQPFSYPSGVSLQRQDKYLQASASVWDSIEEIAQIRIFASTNTVYAVLHLIFGLAIIISSAVIVGYFIVIRTLGRISSQVSFALILLFVLLHGLFAYWLVLASGYQDRGQQLSSILAERLNRAVALGINLENFNDISQFLSEFERNQKDIAAINILHGSRANDLVGTREVAMLQSRPEVGRLEKLFHWFDHRSYATIRDESPTAPRIGVLVSLDRTIIAWQFFVGSLRIVVPALVLGAVGILGLHGLYFVGRRRRPNAVRWGRTA